MKNHIYEIVFFLNFLYMFFHHSLSTYGDLLLFRIVSGLIAEIEESIKKSSLLDDIRVGELPALCAKCTEFVELLVSLSYCALVFNSF